MTEGGEAGAGGVARSRGHAHLRYYTCCCWYPDDGGRRGRGWRRGQEAGTRPPQISPVTKGRSFSRNSQLRKWPVVFALLFFKWWLYLDLLFWPGLFSALFNTASSAAPQILHCMGGCWHWAYYYWSLNRGTKQSSILTHKKKKRVVHPTTPQQTG